MPDSMSSCGVLNTPPASNTSRALTAWWTRPSLAYSTPTARDPSRTTRVASAFVSTVRLGRAIAGRRKATEALQRRPFLIVH